MKYSVVIPAHNEAAFIGQTLVSLENQTVLPSEAIVVDDHSDDRTRDVATEFAVQNAWLSVIDIKSGTDHLPGSKVIRAFQKGFEHLSVDFDVIVKLDADLILPPDYFEAVLRAFTQNSKAGIVGGFAYIERNGEWILENLTDKDHIRGAFKAYRKACFEQIGGLKPAMGWDTADELLAKFYGWEVVTLAELKVKHLKATGVNYNKAARYKQGEAFYSLGYGFLITVLASAKLAVMKRKPMLFFDYMSGFFKAKTQGLPMLVTGEQAKFTRGYRWQKMRGKFFRSIDA